MAYENDIAVKVRKMKMLWKYILIVIGGLLCADTAFFLTRTSGHLGIWLPGLLGLPLLLAGVFYAPLGAFFASGRMGHTLKLMLIFLYIALILFFAFTSLFLYKKGNERAPYSADALVVLGCHLYGARPSLTLTKRLDTALEYLEHSPRTICFVTGGQSGDETTSEGAAMRDYLIARGIDASRIVVEDKSTSTYENFRFTAPLIRERCGENASIVFTTTKFHTYRAARTALRAGLRVEGYSAPGVWYITPNDYLRECVALAGYAAMGRL
ncbi:MAG: YdcF family protein [Clostridia bacterium]|nr:YdcF family protein [Clostridia bacterium]